MHFHGHGGWSLLQLELLCGVEGRVRGASMVFHEIGTNDLGHPDRDPELFAWDICTYAEHLRVGFDAEKVVIVRYYFVMFYLMQFLLKVLSGPMMPSKVAWSLWIIFIFGAIRAF